MTLGCNRDGRGDVAALWRENATDFHRSQHLRSHWSPRRQRLAGKVDLARVRTVDLTHPFNAETLYWPTAPTGFQLQQLAAGPTPGEWWYSSYAFAAPIHFSERPDRRPSTGGATHRSRGGHPELRR
jgi:hypothetical protein